MKDIPETTDFLPEDYRFTAELLRKHINTDITLFRAVCSNNLSIILGALDKAGAAPEPQAPDPTGHDWTALPFWSCRCPAPPGDPCPLTLEECGERTRVKP